MTTTHTFAKAPSSAPLMLKAALPALPGIGGLPGVKHVGTDAPDVVLERPGVAVDADHLARYHEVCGFGPSDRLPITYPHMAAFGLHMALMTDVAFPFAPMGLVHLRNNITQHKPLTAKDVFDVAVRATNLRPHPKGRLIDILTDVTVDGETVWTENMTLFARGKGGAPEETPAPLEGLEAPSGVVRWKLAGNLGRRYGAVSGDRNPIHLYPVTAKAFGFPSNIAHGMWTKAHALAAIANRTPDAASVDVEFKKPILLPATVVFGARTEGRTTEFGVTGSKKPVTHMVGRVGPLA
ncbi:MAG: MaoC/PaaZ C-terminal domain-containing protein [Aeromicrobium sp.]|uniref:MaoC/PaaZ C-terminal domain-containing protein n=1 Tax=Aeromicrobium sp. TaxID=1871063 RepID=UPI0039E3DFF7